MRWLSFNGVGAMGVAVQLTVLAVLIKLAGVHYLVATAIAVETAVLHNFVWHQRWTWRDRPAGSARRTALRLARFHLLNGAVSMVGNLGVMTILAGTLGIDPIAANVVAIAACSVVNFLASEVLVFRTSQVAVAVLSVATGVLGFPATSRACRFHGRVRAPRRSRRGSSTSARSTSATDARHPRPTRSSRRMRSRNRAGASRRSAADLDGADRCAVTDLAAPSIPDGRVHHWVGAVFVPDVDARQRHPPSARPRGSRVGVVRRRDGVEAAFARRRPGPRVHEASPRERHHGQLQHRAQRRVPDARVRACVEPQRGHEDRRARRGRHAARARAARRHRITDSSGG